MDGRKAILVLAILALLLPDAARAEFLLESVDVEASDISPDGSVKIRESIKLIINGDYSQALYDSGYSGYSNNDLSFWSTTTSLKDVKRHINPAKTEINDFTLTPQPRKKCNPVQGICHGELILEYTASPAYNTTDGVQTPVQGTGLFTVENYKPRTTRYTLNQEALSFTTTEQGNVLLEDNVRFTMKFPSGTLVTKLNPLPESVDVALPARISELTWEDMVLVKFTAEFEVEESLQKEVSEFFSGFVRAVESGLAGPYGFAIIILAFIIIGGYIYIRTAKRKKEE
ncbi:hypothetical protein H0O02_00650 [Candidatus Micrarchaeota archaeon]|nr:hypothetical protein [Candidatus Micrarchaeota archaeon]